MNENFWSSMPVSGEYRIEEGHIVSRIYSRLSRNPRLRFNREEIDLKTAVEELSKQWKGSHEIKDEILRESVVRKKDQNIVRLLLTYASSPFIESWRRRSLSGMQKRHGKNYILTTNNIYWILTKIELRIRCCIFQARNIASCCFSTITSRLSCCHQKHITRTDSSKLRMRIRQAWRKLISLFFGYHEIKTQLDVVWMSSLWLFLHGTACLMTVFHG